MDLFFDLLRSVIYGVIEGITEWLPISSTGHMILAEQVLKFSFSAEFMEVFRVVIQLGAILAVVVMYFKKLWPFCVDNGRDSGLAKHVRWPVMRLWFKIIVACLPAAVLGLALDDWIDAHFYNSVVVAVMHIVPSVALSAKLLGQCIELARCKFDVGKQVDGRAVQGRPQRQNKMHSGMLS